MGNIAEEELKIPEMLPMLPVRDTVIFPYMILPLFVGRESSIKAVDEALAKDRMIFLATQKVPTDDHPVPEGIYTVGTAAMVMKMLKLPDGRVKILVQGLAKGIIKEYIQQKPLFMVRIQRVIEPPAGEIPRDRSADSKRQGTEREGLVAEGHPLSRCSGRSRPDRRTRAVGRSGGLQPQIEDRRSPEHSGNLPSPPALEKGQ